MSIRFGRQRGKAKKSNQVHEVDVESSMELAANDPRERMRELARDVLGEVRSAQMHKLPMLPGVAAKAMELAQRKDVDIRQLEAVIAPDAMITARVLAIANSPLYGVGAKVSSLRTALMRLGVELMCDILCQTVAEAHMFKGSNETKLKWQRLHGVGCAYMARDISSRLRESIESPFLCGLMHDLGETILWQVLDASDRWKLSEHDANEIVRVIHPHVGEAIVERWRLPPVIAKANRRHHRYRGFRGATGYCKVGNVVHLADRLMHDAGVAEPGTFDEAPLRYGSLELDAAFVDLGFDADDAESLRDVSLNIKDQLGV